MMRNMLNVVLMMALAVGLFSSPNIMQLSYAQSNSIDPDNEQAEETAIDPDSENTDMASPQVPDGQGQFCLKGTGPGTNNPCIPCNPTSPSPGESECPILPDSGVMSQEDDNDTDASEDADISSEEAATDKVLVADITTQLESMSKQLEDSGFDPNNPPSIDINDPENVRLGITEIGLFLLGEKVLKLKDCAKALDDANAAEAVFVADPSEANKQKLGKAIVDHWIKCNVFM